MLTIWSGKRNRLCDGTTRRSFLTVGALGFGGLTLAELLQAQAAAPPSAVKSIIMITLGGGPSHIDMYDLKPDAPAEIRGEFKPIRTSVPGFDICELMPEQAKIADKLALVRNLSMSTSSHNNDQEVLSGYLYDRMFPGARGVPRPSFGSVVSYMKNAGPGMPAYVSLRREQLNEGSLYLGPRHQPFVPTGAGLEDLGLNRNVGIDRLADRKHLLASFDGMRREMDAKGEQERTSAFTARALDLISSPRARAAFDLAREPERIRASYGLTADLPTYNANYYIWSKFLLARRLVEAGVPVVTLEAFGEWDTHGDNFKTLRRLVPVLDKGIAALVSDLHQRGMGKEVAVVVWGEFGRTPRITPYNNTPGRDHHGPANFVLFAGGGMKTGQVIGATDSRGERPKGQPYTPQHVLATLYRLLGIDAATTVLDHTGRPMYLLDDREMIDELV